MASNSNRRSGSSGSNRRSGQNPSSSGQASSYGNAKAGRYASRSSAEGDAFSKRLQQSRSAQSSPSTQRYPSRAAGASRSSQDSRSASSSSSRYSSKVTPLYGTQRPASGHAARSTTTSVVHPSTRPLYTSTYGGKGTQTSSRGGGSSSRASKVTALPSSRSQVPSSAIRDAGSRNQAERSRFQGYRQTGQSGHPYAQTVEPQGVPGQTYRDRRMGDVRKAQRRRQIAKTYNRYVLRLAILLVLVLVLVAAGVVVFNSSLFTVSNVEVNGTNYLTAEDVIAIADIPDGITLQRLDKNAIVDNLTSNPWIESAKVTRTLPDTIVIDVTERKIAAVVQIPMTEVNATVTKWAIASDGVWLAQVEAIDSTDTAAAAAAASTATSAAAASTAASAAATDTTAADDTADTTDTTDETADTTDYTTDTGDTTDYTDDTTDYTDDNTDTGDTTDYTDDTGGDGGDATETQAVFVAPGASLQGLGFAMAEEAAATPGSTATSAQTTASAAATASVAPAASASAAASSASSASSAVADATAANADIMRRVAVDSASLPLIVDVSTDVLPEAGKRCTDEGVQNALSIISTLSSDLLSQISSISAASAEKTTLTLDNGVIVAFGSSDDCQAKERTVLQLLSEHAGMISYINVRVVDRPAWRGIG